MSREETIGVLYSLENELRLLAVQWSRTYFSFLNAGDLELAQKAQGIYEGIQTAIMAIATKRREIEGGRDDDRGHRKSTQQGEADPETPARD